MNIQELYRLYQKYPRVVTDSRKIIPGSIFFALKGDKYNGNLFAGEALRKGSAFVVVDDESVISDSRYILVPDSLEALQELAKVHRMALKTKVIAVTGSNGKTTTKELLRDVLKRKYPVTATEGNLNNHIGVPLTVLNLSTDDAFAIVEMGASHTGEIGRLCKIANPGMAHR